MEPTPVRVAEMSDVLAVEGEGDTLCALLADGRVSCWGDNSSGQVGNGETRRDPPSKRYSTPAIVAGQTDVASVTSTDDHTCPVLPDGAVWCWGDNSRGQLGDGTFTSSSVPVRVSGINSAVHISTDLSSSCALLGDGTVWCWGSNMYGELGNGERGSKKRSNVPVVCLGCDPRSFPIECCAVTEFAPRNP